MSKQPILEILRTFCRLALIVLTMLSPVSSHAHPLSVSYVDLRIEPTGVEASIEAQAVDLAHDIPGTSEAKLLTPAGLSVHQPQVVQLLTSRLQLTVAGRQLEAIPLGVELRADQGAVRLSLHYDWDKLPAKIEISALLFTYHPGHKSFVDIYQSGALKQQLVFERGRERQTYFLGRRQTTGSVVGTFIYQGVMHIFTGPDHVLFILGLLLLGGTLKQLLKIVTAFTVAHSVTLCLAALNVLNPAARIIEPAIALSIVIVGVYSMMQRNHYSAEEKRWDARLLLAFGFGFIHGFGFANALRELELPQQALVQALFSFNLGVEFGQACIVLAAAPLLTMLHRRKAIIAQRLVTAGSFGVIAVGGYWFIQRVISG